MAAQKRAAKTAAPANAAGRLWLFKEEPSSYSLDDLLRDGQSDWVGVKNPLARQHLRQMRIGDRVLYYHTGKEKAIVGEMQVVGGPSADPANDDPQAVIVRVGAARRWPQPVTLAQIKADEFFADWELVRMSRLSVMPVTPQQWQRLAKWGGVATSAKK